MISVEEALSRVLALAGPPAVEALPLDLAFGRALAAPVAARLTQPPFDAAAMDGYAIRAAEADLQLRVIGEAAAGHPFTGTPGPGTAIRIFTGAPVPPFYDRVAIQEEVERDGDLIRLASPDAPPCIRPAGSDFSAGDSVLPGRLLDAATIGLIAAMNVPTVTVARRPRVIVLAGGDELVAPGTDPGPGQIVSSNDLTIAALAAEAGAEAQRAPILRDEAGAIRAALAAAAAAADLIVTIGGASVGDHDLIGRVAADLGMERSFYRIAMRPGKPLMAGRIGRAAMLGLPGNPVSAWVCGLIFMQPLIRAMQGLPPGAGLEAAVLGAPIGAEGPRQHYRRATLVRAAGGLPIVTPHADQDSARLGLAAAADALLVRPAGDAARAAGAIVSMLPLRRA